MIKSLLVLKNRCHLRQESVADFEPQQTRAARIFAMSFLLGVACLVCRALAGGFSTVPGTGFFVDGDGVQRLFRGVNLVRKEPGAWQVTHEELNVMQKLGLNVVRYGVIWSNVEEAPGVYNDTYLKEVRGQIELLYSHGIYSFLEMHQDLLSPFFCAGQDGSPFFYNMPPNSSEYLKGGSKAYPMPFAKPEYVEGPSAEAYGPWGQPKCGRLSQWGESYATYASCSTWQAFYDNVDGVQDWVTGSPAMLCFWILKQAHSTQSRTLPNGTKH